MPTTQQIDLRTATEEEVGGTSRELHSMCYHFCEIGAQGQLARLRRVCCCFFFRMALQEIDGASLEYTVMLLVQL
jgi:hypothetical protein